MSDLSQDEFINYLNVNFGKENISKIVERTWKNGTSQLFKGTAYKLFEQLREYDKLTPEKANEKRLDMQKLTSAEDNGLNYRQKLINKFLLFN